LLVLDANIAVKLVCIEPGYQATLERLQSEVKLVAPEWVMIESGHAIRRKSLSGEFDTLEAQRLLSLIPSFFETLYRDGQLVEPAMALSFELDHWIYDCIYLACALDIGAPMLTADRKFWNAAKRGGYEDVVELLTWQEQTV
jgi:predicted nucleic acid-binding protein